MGITKVNSNWSKISTKDYIYNRTDGGVKTRRISTGYKWVATFGGTFQIGGTDIMVVDGLS